MGRTGTATLPLHYGRVPEWLSSRMAALGRVIVEAIALQYGRDEVLRRLSHPHWFQSFGAVMGMDWHSSGITTTVIGALKRGLAPVADELGIYVCGGRGSASRETPAELLAVGERVGLDGEKLGRTSRLVAKIDGAAVQDGYDLYLHGFIVAADGKWTVVQQGMSAAKREARRYHWLSEGLRSFVDSPHAAIDGAPHPEPILNLADARAAPSRAAQLSFLREGPEKILAEVAAIEGRGGLAQLPLLPHLELPAHHDVRRGDVSMKRLGGALAAVSERAPTAYEDVLLTPGVGPRTLFALALVADVMHGAPARFSDPARHSLAHGGKDGHPYPVPTKVYDETIRVLKRAVGHAKLGHADKLAALKKLDEEARRLERFVADVDFDGFVEEEHRRSHSYGGRTVAGPVVPTVPAGNGDESAAAIEPGGRERAERFRAVVRPTRPADTTPREQMRLFGRPPRRRP
jgi:uncharacterized protein